MASEYMEELPEIQVASLVNEEPATKPPSQPPPDPKVDSGQVLDGNGGQALSQDPGSQESQAPEEPTQPMASEEGTGHLLGLSFPRKLWAIVENDAFGSVRWGGEGDTMVIDADLFQREVLGRRGAERIFESNSLKSFIHQLNLYGFSKIRSKDAEAHSWGKKRMMIYRNSNFQKDKPGLLDNICKKGEGRSAARRGTCAAKSLKNPAEPESSMSSAKKKKLVPTRRSPRLHPEAQREEALPQGQGPDHQGPRCMHPFMPSGLWVMSTVSEQPLENQPLQEPSGAHGEGTSENDTSVPQATARMEGEGEVPRHPLGYPDYGSVMSLYNACYSILLASLLAMSPREPADEGQEGDNEEEAQEGSADYKCALCEQFKDNPSL